MEETDSLSVTAPAFINSREIKEMGTVFAKIRGARSVGVLLTPADVFVVYDLGNSLMKWEYKSEMRTKALMKTVLCRERRRTVSARGGTGTPAGRRYGASL